MKHLTTGVNCATLTPMDSDGAACIPLLAAHCRWLLAQGCANVVLLGTTGEANSFSLEERKAILEDLLETGLEPQRLIVGTGCCAIDDTVTLTRHALRCGVDRVLVLPPFYYKNIEDAGLIEAFAKTIDAVGDGRLRLYLYQIPQLTGVAFSAAVIESLLHAYPAIIAGIKDSSGDWEGIRALCFQFGKRMDVLAGSERFLIAALRAGATGCVTATANAHPAMIA
ncbi:MAG: dihydrodipicolinate synthase family protein, partial [Candidatus Eremiobacteraeota bacterium]|nr:dihydrodipicolinate synthase family protein [Candidatus Eremiobacteraeota bacterium]